MDNILSRRGTWQDSNYRDRPRAATPYDEAMHGWHFCCIPKRREYANVLPSFLVGDTASEGRPEP